MDRYTVAHGEIDTEFSPDILLACSLKTQITILCKVVFFYLSSEIVIEFKDSHAVSLIFKLILTFLIPCFCFYLGFSKEQFFI